MINSIIIVIIIISPKLASSSTSSPSSYYQHHHHHQYHIKINIIINIIIIIVINIIIIVISIIKIISSIIALSTRDPVALADKETQVITGKVFYSTNPVAALLIPKSHNCLVWPHSTTWSHFPLRPKLLDALSAGWASKASHKQHLL